MSLFIHKPPNIISNNILPPPPPPSNMSNLSAIGMGSGQLPPTLGGGGGGLECDQISDIRPPKNQISDIRPPPKIKYQIISCSQKSDIWLKKIRCRTPKKNQISDITPPKKSNIGYQGTPVPPPSSPPPHSVTPCDPGLRQSVAAPLRSFAS